MARARLVAEMRPKKRVLPIAADDDADLLNDITDPVCSFSMLVICHNWR
jgi:hypothetical protein